LPAPLFEQPQGFTRVVLFAHKPLTAMDKADRVRACYLHACLRYVTRQPMTNASVRERFGIAERNASIASRLLNEAVDAGEIALEDSAVGTRVRRYVPFWSASKRTAGDCLIGAEHVNDRETRWVMSLESRRRAWLGSREPRSGAD
jgi:predicted HTH transcriptional regulator